MKYLYILLTTICLLTAPVLADDSKFHSWDANRTNHTIGGTVMFDDAGIKLFYDAGYIFLQNGSTRDVYFEFVSRSFNGMSFKTYIPNEHRSDYYTDPNIVEPGHQGMWAVEPLLEQMLYNTQSSDLPFQYDRTLEATTLFYSLKIGDGDTHLNSHTFLSKYYYDEHFKEFTEHKLIDVNDGGFQGSVYQLETEDSFILLLLNRTDSLFMGTTEWRVNQEPAKFYNGNYEHFYLYPYTAKVMIFPYNIKSLREMDISNPKVTCKISTEKLDESFEPEYEYADFEIIPMEWLTEKKDEN